MVDAAVERMIEAATIHCGTVNHKIEAEVSSMDLWQAIKERHSVRRYLDQAIEGEVLEELRQCIEECKRDSNLHIQLFLNEPNAFRGGMARYGRFSNVKNYIAFVGKNDENLEETCGYYGEKIVLRAQQLGLRTCWVALTFNKRKSRNTVAIKPGEKLLLLISIGYGETDGVPHKTKSLEELCVVHDTMMPWFRRGVEAAQLAPTARNQQKFSFELVENTVRADAGAGRYAKTDLGIVKYHFEIGAAEGDWSWAD